ncbi:enoyl-CoA hydratase/isomerase family protein [Chitinimonas lacunae]|uniref:3-hydroxyisobutyryl-CoA hydrolase n=1 Tax=Chitinimonas lacunae TaxID=1963018 RepID=A0ABV8MNU3_9NEIS
MTDPVLFSVYPAANGHQIAVATLNAEKSLNALSLPMIRALAPQLRAWRDDPAVACVLLQGAGERAFCAGGDVVDIHNAIRAGNLAHCDDFFTEEYALDHLIHSFPKPLLVWGHGIVMGGGVGLMVGASHRIVTEKSRIAMPEVTIGLYPDVGGSWFLNRLPGRLGIYLGLTGASFSASDALYVGLADFALPSAFRLGLIEALQAVAWQGQGEADRRLLSHYLRDASRQAALDLPPSQVRAHYDTIVALTDYDTVEEIVKAITDYAGDDEWLRGGAKKLAAGSPTSMHLIVEAQKRARHLSLREVFEMELNVSRQCCRQHDFAEGVRALLVDKDNAPRWQPATLAGVDPAVIEAHFHQPTT